MRNTLRRRQNYRYDCRVFTHISSCACSECCDSRHFLRCIIARYISGSPEFSIRCVYAHSSSYACSECCDSCHFLRWIIARNIRRSRVCEYDLHLIRVFYVQVISEVLCIAFCIPSSTVFCFLRRNPHWNLFIVCKRSRSFFQLRVFVVNPTLLFFYHPKTASVLLCVFRVCDFVSTLCVVT